MRNPLKFWLGTLTVVLLALTPSVVPVGGSIAPAFAATVGSGACQQTVDSATGVTATSVTVSGVSHCLVTFTAIGSRTWTVPAGVTQLEYLIVAGGGAGGRYRGGGGGGGGVLEGTTTVAAGNQTITVGAGGIGSSYNQVAPPTNGGNSSAFGRTAFGGGRGGTLDRGGEPPATGGSGGGGGAWDNARQTGALGTAGQGFEGGAGSFAVANGRSGGGGGAGGAGLAGTISGAGNGGPGVLSTITGSDYGGGGGGGLDNRGVATARGLGGVGGGGAGGTGEGGSPPDLPAVDGQANTGGGGGGNGQGSNFYDGGTELSGDGGSGIVVVRYSLNPGPPTGTSVSSGDGQLTLGYTLPAHTGGGTLSLEYTTDGGSNWRDLGETDGTTTVSLESDGTALVNGTFYTVKLRAKNTVGGSSFTGSEVTVGTVIPSPVGEVIRFDATHPDSFTVGDASWTDLRGGLSGALVGNAGFDARSKAFVLDGDGDYVTPGSFGVDFSRGLAIHAVVDFGEVVNYERLLEFTSGNGTNGNIALGRFSTTDQLYFEAWSNSGTAYTCTSGTGAITAGFQTYSWIVASDGTCTFRKNGADLPAADSSGALPALTVRDANYIGAARGASSPLKGSIQSVIIYNTAQVVPTCHPIESTFTGDGSIGEAGVPYKVLQFTTVGVCDWTSLTGVREADFAAVGGGGGGGAYVGGGGSGGEVDSVQDSSISSDLRVSVGAGGAGAANVGDYGTERVATAGRESSVSMGGSTLLEAAGGSIGGGNPRVPGTGVNGGGGGLGTGLSGGDGSGFDGGNGSDAPHHLGGGGAGAGADGADATASVAGAGGSGAVVTLSGSSVTYGGGGGGGVHGSNSGTFGPYTAGSGGAGGGGSGGAATSRTEAELVMGESGQSGLGGGGGGAGKNSGVTPLADQTFTSIAGAGGSGIVVVRYSLGPAAPAISSVSSGDGSLSVSFSAPTHTGGSGITDYEYSFDGSTWTSFSSATAGTKTISGLTNGTAYTPRIRAVNGNG
ncbi:MAG: fibronectin type III domain-containing protein, partial [Pontimonas sp.]|nr:fibronectin type III domain-containing protein [Pontimonas sp.]